MSFKVTIPIDEPLKNIITLFDHVSTSVLLEFEDDERLAWKTCSTDKSITYIAYMEPESFHMGEAEGFEDIDPDISHVEVDLNPISFNAQLLFLHVLHSAVLQGSRIELDINLALPYVPFNILDPDGNTMEFELDQDTIDEDFPEHFRDGTFHGTRVEQPGFAKLLEFNDPQHTIRRLELPTILLRSLVLFSSSLENLSDGEEHGIPFIAWRTILLIYCRNLCNGIFTFRYVENDENAGNIEGEFCGLRLSLDQLPFPLQILGMAKRVTIENAPFIVSMQVSQHLCLRIYIPSNAAVRAQIYRNY